MGSEKSWLREVAEALLVALVFAVFARTWLVQAFKIPTGSMEHNLLVGDHILVNKFVYGPASGRWERILLPSRTIRRGDVVVFKFPEDPARDFIKRCVGLPGDEVDLVDKRLRINGRPVPEPYVEHTDSTTYPESPFVPEHYRARDNFGPFVVPPGHYFCMGDNRDNSHDSRFWGPVPEEFVKGRAVLVYWSVSSGGEGPTPVGAGEGPSWRAPFADLGRMVGQTRWERTFRMVR
jgi:signal peptidase I